MSRTNTFFSSQGSSIYIHRSINETGKRMFKESNPINPIAYMQSPKYSTTPAVFIIGSTPTEVNKGTLLNEVRVATIRTCMSSVKGVWVEGGEVYHLGKYV